MALHKMPPRKSKRKLLKEVIEGFVPPDTVWEQRTKRLNGPGFIGDGKHEVEFPDSRVDIIRDYLEIKGLNILEPGCMEGQLTVSLLLSGALVDTFDAKLQNCLLCKSRAEAYGFNISVPNIDVYNILQEIPETKTYDLIAFCGLLYHLENPVIALRLLSLLSSRMWIDTHISIQGKQGHEHRLNSHDLQAEDFGGIVLKGKWYSETPHVDMWGGIGCRSFWMTEESLWSLLYQCGFKSIQKIWHDEKKSRIMVLATK